MDLYKQNMNYSQPINVGWKHYWNFRKKRKR